PWQGRCDAPPTAAVPAPSSTPSGMRRAGSRTSRPTSGHTGRTSSAGPKGSLGSLAGCDRLLRHHRVSVPNPAVDPPEPAGVLARRVPEPRRRTPELDAPEPRAAARSHEAGRRPQKGGAPGGRGRRRELDGIENLAGEHGHDLARRPRVPVDGAGRAAG